MRYIGKLTFRLPQVGQRQRRSASGRQEFCNRWLPRKTFIDLRPRSLPENLKFRNIADEISEADSLILIATSINCVHFNEKPQQVKKNYSQGFKKLPRFSKFNVEWKIVLIIR